MKKLLCLLALLPLAAWAQPRSERLLEKGWLFTRGDAPEFARNDCDDSDWQPVTVPHDWAIYCLLYTSDAADEL
mgnify:CR=1 FL=1